MTPEPSDRVLTIPNLVSFTRLLGVPVFWWALVVADNIELAAALIFIIGSTDWLDGYLARRLNQVSKLGKALDPIADRLMLASAVVGGLITDVLPPVIGYPLIVREVLMFGVTTWLVSRGGGVLEVRYAGKVATFLLYGAIPSFYLEAAGFLPGLFGPAAWIAGVAGLILYWSVTMAYIGDARRQTAALKSKR